MLHYILQIVAFQLFFLIIYDVFLKKETFFNWNRAYLLSTAILSLALPFIKINKFKEIVPEEFVIRLPEVIIGNLSTSQIDATIIAQQTQQQSNFVWSWELLFFGGMLIATLFLVFKVGKLLWMIYNNPKRWKGNILIIKLLKSNAAFSFFHYIFLGEHIKSKERETIISHELIHVKHKHTLDLLFFELMRIVFWFNPLIYMYQNRITTLHEYIADAKAIKDQGKKEYYQNLLSQVFETQNISFVNTFFKQSLIKKRIIMLSKSKSNRNHILKYALLIPMVFCMLLYTSSYTQEKTSKTDEVNQRLTDKELEDMYYNQLIKMDDKEFSSSKTFNEYFSNNDKYIKTREEHLKERASFRFLNDVSNKRKKQGGKIKKEHLENFKRLLDKSKNYTGYLEWKKTDKAKRSWESNIKNGVLRLVVDDLSNFTAEEQRRYDKKMKMIIEDDYFKELLIVDVSGKEKTIIHEVLSIDKKSTNTNEKAELIPLSELVINDVEESIEIPFSIIDETPTFKFCEALSTNEERKKCMSDNISKHVNKNFNLDLAKSLGLEGRQRINVIFKIDTLGNVVDIRSRAPHPDLAEEAIRVISTLPQFIPGKHNGKAVIVPYSLPILFQVNIDESKNEEERKTLRKVLEESIKALDEKLNNDDSISFSIVDEIPTFSFCKTLETKVERKKCTADNIAKYVNKNFNLDLATSLGLEGRQRINAIFKIDTEGNVVNIRVRAPHPDLEAETKRAINTLPQFIPGKHNGKGVVVTYSLPILFSVKE